MASSDALDGREGEFEVRIGAIPDGGEVALARKQHVMITLKVKRPVKVMGNMFCIGGLAEKKEARRLSRMNARVTGYLCDNVPVRMELVNVIQVELPRAAWVFRGS